MNPRTLLYAVIIYFIIIVLLLCSQGCTDPVPINTTELSNQIAHKLDSLSIKKVIIIKKDSIVYNFILKDSTVWNIVQRDSIIILLDTTVQTVILEDTSKVYLNIIVEYIIKDLKGHIRIAWTPVPNAHYYTVFLRTDSTETEQHIRQYTFFSMPIEPYIGKTVYFHLSSIGDFGVASDLTEEYSFFVVELQ